LGRVTAIDRQRLRHHRDYLASPNPPSDFIHPSRPRAQPARCLTFSMRALPSGASSQSSFSSPHLHQSWCLPVAAFVCVAFRLLLLLFHSLISPALSSSTPHAEYGFRGAAQRVPTSTDVVAVAFASCRCIRDSACDWEEMRRLWAWFSGTHTSPPHLFF
jgi:hypothetical protein